jgi:hypothetical protein
MSKGLKLTLLTVAVALMGMYAMAEAPVVDQIPTVIIGGGTAGSTPPDVFVYPEALDLSTYVTDDGGDAGIVWSYDVVGTAKYSFNGVDPLGGADPITPGALEINTQVLQGEYDTDTDADTVTIRNIRLSPFSGTGETPDAPGALFDSQVVTLWASDGATATQGEVMIWTDNGGPDRLSTEVPTGEKILDLDLTNNAPGWGTNTLKDTAGTLTMSAGANGICVEVSAPGVNIGWYSSGYGFADLVDNAVYQVQMEVTGSQTTAGLGPLWDVIIDNLSDDGFTSGGNVYFYDALFLDNEGGANAASLGRTAFEVWFTPPSVNLASWRDLSTGAFSTANEPHNDMRFQFRVLDGDAASGYGGELDLGQICLGGVVVYRYDIGDVVAGAAVYNDAITDANVYQHALLGQTAFSFDAGGLTVGPSGSDWGTDISYVEPGDGVFTDPTDDYPIPWNTADQLYMLEVNMKAADAASAASPPDVIQIGVDVGTNELIQLNGITAGGRGLNKIGTPQETSGTFVAFFYSHTPSLTTAADYKRFRPRIQILNSTDLSFEGQTTTTGDIVVESWSIKPVSFN